MGNEVLVLNEALNEALELLNSEEAVKILVTLDDNGTPHPAAKNSLRREGGTIVYTEFLESSRTNRYMTRSLWFDRTVSILVLIPGGKSYKITALPVRVVVSGKIFQAYYEEVREKFGGALDLAAVWFLKPLEIFEETLEKRAAEEAGKRSYFLHLDRLAKSGGRVV
jgi:hypothetical protein